MSNINGLVGMMVAMLLGYLGITLALGAKKVYFDKDIQTTEDEKK